MTDNDETAPVSAEMLWSLIERRADEDPAFRHHLLAFVVLQSQGTAVAGRLFDMLGLPRDRQPAPNINPMSMFLDVGVGALQTTTPEELTFVSNFIKDTFGYVLSANDPSLLSAFLSETVPGSASGSPPDPDPDS